MANTISLQEIQNNMTQKLSEKANVNHNHNSQYLSLEQAGELTKLNTTKKTSLVDAVNELFQFASDGKAKIATAITGKGIPATSSETFDSLTSKINTIETNPLKDELITDANAFKTDLYAKLNSMFYTANENTEAANKQSLINTLKVTGLTSANTVDEILNHLSVFRQYLNDYMNTNNILSGTGLKIETLITEFNNRVSSSKITEAWVKDKWFKSLITMPTPRSYPTSAVVNNKIYVIGGNNSNGGSLNTVEEYNPINNTWVTKQPMPTFRSNLASAVVNDKIYIIGGYNNNTGQVNVVEEYDPFTNTWSNKRFMPTTRYILTASSVNNKIYTIGGYTAGVGSVNTVEEYNPSTDTWSTKQSMSTSRSNLTSSSAFGKIYVIGGSNIDGVLGSVEEYNPSTNTWITKKTMPSPRSSLTSSEINNKIYVIGGYNSGIFFNKVEEYNPYTDTWLTKEPMSEVRYNLTSAVVRNKIYVFGGNNDKNILNTVEVYYP